MPIEQDKSNQTAMVDDHPGHHNLLGAGVNRVEAKIDTLNESLSGGASGKILEKKTASDYDFQWVTKPSGGGSGGGGGGDLPELTNDGDVLTVENGSASAGWKRPTKILSGSALPESAIGEDGDVYLQYAEASV